METTVIMTNCSGPYCKSYIMFEIKGSEKHIGEVDRRDGKYFIYYDGNGKSLRPIGTRYSKDIAIKYLQEAIEAGIQGPVAFKWNVMRYKYKLA